MTDQPVPPGPPPLQYPGPGPGTYVPVPRGNGLAITAIVLSALALLGVMVIGLFIALSGGFDSYTLDGRVPASNGRVQGHDLESALRHAIENDGGSVDKIECPEVWNATQGVSVLCDSTIDGTGWVEVVVFENDRGDFTFVAY